MSKRTRKVKKYEPPQVQLIKAVRKAALKHSGKKVSFRARLGELIQTSSERKKFQVTLASILEKQELRIPRNRITIAPDVTYGNYFVLFFLDPKIWRSKRRFIALVKNRSAFWHAAAHRRSDFRKARCFDLSAPTQDERNAPALMRGDTLKLA